MSFGEGDLHKRVEELENEVAHLKYLVGTRDDSIRNLVAVLDNRQLNLKRSDYALWLACRELYELVGTCPFDMHDYEVDGCSECVMSDDVPECWVAYFNELAGVSE